LQAQVLVESPLLILSDKRQNFSWQHIKKGIEDNFRLKNLPRFNYPKN
jgi:hypothetical protein